MEEETRKAFDNMVEHVDELRGDITTLRSDMEKGFAAVRDDMDKMRNEMVTKEYLKQSLESLQADVATKESVRSLVQIAESKEDHGGNG